MFKKLTGSQKQKNTKAADFLRYWDFMTAVAAAPGFCTAHGMGKMASITPWLLCKKELAAFFAVAIAFTNENDKAKVASKTDPKTKKVVPGKPFEL